METSGTADEWSSGGTRERSSGVCEKRGRDVPAIVSDMVVALAGEPDVYP